MSTPVSAAPTMARRRSLAAGLALLIVLAVAPGAAASQRSAVAGDASDGAGWGGSGVPADAVSGTLEGIDVSHWQGTINWTQVAAAGKKFAIIKATESTTYTDPLYATNQSQAKAAGLWTGAYHFAQPSTNANDAILEADHFVAVMNLGVGDLIPALDLEVAGGLGVSALQAWVRSFLDRVTLKIGVRPMIYTSPSFWGKYMGDTRALADAGYKTLWVAHWGVSAPTVPAQNWGGKGWTFWQYTSDGAVPGISGRVDLDRFNGTDLATQAFSIFKLAAALPSGSVKQGASSAASVAIVRTNFPSEVALEVAGLPAGTTATFNANPTTATSASLTVTTPADPAATPVGTYPLTITGIGGELTKTTTLNLVIADGIAPTLAAPRTRLVAGRTLGTTTVPVRVTWAASDPSGLASTALQRSINGGSWATTPQPSGAALAADSSIPFGGTASQRVRAADTKGNLSAWLAGGPVRASVDQQTSNLISWTGAWRTTAATSASGGSVRYATANGASATFRFSGSSVAWVSTRGTSHGSVSVYVDGVYAGVVNLYSTSGHARAVVFARSWSKPALHTLKIVVRGTAGHPRVDVDAFLRLATG